MKYIYTTFLVFISLVAPLSAAECSKTCALEDGPAPVITEYIVNMDGLLANIREAAASQKNNTPNSSIKKDISQVKQQVMTGYNKILSFGEYYGSFDFHVLMPLTQDIPYQVKRDYNKISDYSKRLSNMLEAYERKNIAYSSVSNPCNGLSNCSYSSNTTIRDLISSSIQNNQQILLLLTESLSGRGDTNGSFKLVGSDFKSQLKLYYNKEVLTSCSACEGGTFANFAETISNISYKTSAYSEGAKTWTDAWAMLRGQAPAELTREAEERVLAQYLSEQNISSGQANVVMDNLRRYNSSGLSSSNPIENTKQFLKNSAQEEYRTFDEAVLEKFRDKDSVSIVEIAQGNADLENTDQIRNSIDTLFNDQRPYAFTQDTATMQLQSRLIKMHFSLSESINMLDEILPLAIKICDKQGIGGGICDYSK